MLSHFHLNINNYWNIQRLCVTSKEVPWSHMTMFWKNFEWLVHKYLKHLNSLFKCMTKLHNFFFKNHFIRLLLSIKCNFEIMEELIFKHVERLRCFSPSLLMKAHNFLFLQIVQNKSVKINKSKWKLLKDDLSKATKNCASLPHTCFKFYMFMNFISFTLFYFLYLWLSITNLKSLYYALSFALIYSLMLFMHNVFIQLFTHT